MADPTYVSKVYRQQGGKKFIVASGGTIDIEAGGRFEIAGVQVTASAADLNEATGGHTGTTADVFTFDSLSTDVKVAIDTNSATGNFTATIVPQNLGANITLSLPDSTGTLALTTDTSINVDLGSSGVPGSLDIFPTTAANGKLVFTATDMGGAWNMTITNDAIAAARAYSIPDAGGDGQFVMTTTAFQLLVNANAGDRTMSLSGNVSLSGAFTTTGAFDCTFAVPDSSTWTLPAGGGALALATGAETGTTANTFEINSDGNGVTLSSTGLGADRIMTFPDASGEVVLIDATQTLTAKTLTTPTIGDLTNATHDHSNAAGGGAISAGTLTADNIVCTNAATFGGGYGSAGVTISTAGVIQANDAISTDSTLTADDIVCTEGAIFGGGYGSAGCTISTAGVGEFNGALTTDGLLIADSTQIGGGYTGSGCTISTAGVGEFNGALTTDGTLTALDVSIGGGYGATGLTVSNAGVLQTNGAVTATAITLEHATTPAIVLATGKTNTGTITVNGNTSGSLIVTTDDSTAEAVTLTAAAQTTGATTVTIPNMDNVSASFVMTDTAQTVAGVKTLTGANVHSDANLFSNDGGATGAIAMRFGATQTEGLEVRVYEATLNPNAIETAALNTPAGAVILSVQANVEGALTAGSTTVTWSIGINGTVDKYGTVTGGDGLTQNGKLDTIADWAVLGGAEQMVLAGAITGGGTAGDTALSVGSVRIRVVYLMTNSLDDA